MEEDDVQNPALGGAGEATDTSVPVTEPSGDPLDDIQDEVARAQAKKDRAIARRSAKREPETPVAPAPLQASGPNLTATAVAKTLVPAEVKEHWDELAMIPLEGFNPHDPESIAENMTKRLAVLNASPKKVDPAKDLMTTPGIRGTSGTAPTGDVTSKFKVQARDADSWGS